MVGFIICLIIAAIIGFSGAILNWIEQHGRLPWETTNTSHSNNNTKSRYTHENISAPQKKRHSGRCDGDCANCPPHYGYRHGRWYYGHNHIEGCEFGGNRGGRVI